MIDLLNLEENKISTDFSGYPVVFLGQTGSGKTDSMNRYLRSVAPEGKVPLFIEFEDRYKAVKNLMAQRVYSIPDVLQILGQLQNPKVRERFSGVVFDTIDKFEEMANKYIAANKEVEITEDIGFGKGKRYLNAQVGIITEIRNLGLPVHFTAQLHEKNDIMAKRTWYQTKLNDVTKNQMLPDAFLVGVVALDTKSKQPESSDRLISFKANPTYPELKDGFGGMPVTTHILDLKTEMEKLFYARYEASELTTTQVLEEIKHDMAFADVVKLGQELGNKLVAGGHVEDAMNVLKIDLGTFEDGRVKSFGDLIESQIDLARVVMLKLQDLVNKFGL